MLDALNASSPLDQLLDDVLRDEDTVETAPVAEAKPAVEDGFTPLGLHPMLLQALKSLKYTTPTPVQAQCISPALAGKDLRVCSMTGSGKTAAFVLPALHRLLLDRETNPLPAEALAAPRRAARGNDRNKRWDERRRPAKVASTQEFGAGLGPSILVLAPTRELAMQVSKAAAGYGQNVPGLRTATVVGGMPYPAQLQALAGRLDLLVATPGRLIDHLESGKLRLDRVELLVLDEADRMLDMGFIEDIERIAEALPSQRQTFMVSATFGGHVGRLADEILKDDAVRIDVAQSSTGHANITQRLLWADDHKHKLSLLEHILTEREMKQAVVFTSTQRDADELAAHLDELGHAVAPLHGAMPQGKRNRTLMALRQGHLRILVATDVAARGIDVPDISHVVNFGLPMKAEDYVHRIGRTGRAGRQGQAFTLATRRDSMMLRSIQGYTRQNFQIGQIAGLEPRQPVMDLASRGTPGGGRSDSRFNSGAGGKRKPGGFGSGAGGGYKGKSRDGGWGQSPARGSSFGQRDQGRDERSFAPRNPEGRVFESRPAEGRSFDSRPYEPREQRSFDSRPARSAPPARQHEARPSMQYSPSGMPVSPRAATGHAAAGAPRRDGFKSGKPAARKSNNGSRG